jgi:two-component system, response regulator PdtaR
MMNERILIVEDEMIISATIEETLNKIGYANIETAFNAKKAKELMRTNGYDLVLMDVKLGGEEDGIDVVTEIKKKKDILVIYVTGNSDDKTVKKAKTTLPAGFITKPINENDLRIQLEIILHKDKLNKIDSEESALLSNLYEGDCSGLTISLNLDSTILSMSPHIKKITGRPSLEYINKKIGTAVFDRDFYELLNKLLYRVKYTKERTFYGKIYSPFLGHRIFTIEGVAKPSMSFEFKFTDITEGMFFSSYGNNYCEIAVATDNQDILKGFRNISNIVKNARIIGEATNTDELKTFLKTGKSCILMVDINLDGLIDVLEQERNNDSVKKIIMISSGIESEKLNALDTNLYNGYISKSADDATLFETFQKIELEKKNSQPSN